MFFHDTIYENISVGMQYLFDNIAKAILTDIGTEELAHQEMIASLVYKLIEGACPEDFKKAGWGGQWAQHGCGTFWADANGVPWSAKYTAAHR